MQRAKVVPCPSAPGADCNSLPRAAWPRRVPGARRRLMEPLRLQDPASPCLPRPSVPLPVRRLLRSEGQRASRAAQPGLCPAVRHRPPILRTPCSPRSLRLALPQAESTDPNPNAAPLISKAPVPRFPGIRAELLRPQQQSLRLTSPGGGGGGSPVEEGRGRERAGGGNMAAGVAPAAPAREAGELGLGPCVGSEHNSAAADA